MQPLSACSSRYMSQMDALRRAHGKRVAAQARKVFPSCVRTPMFGDSWWSVRIDNAGNAATTILAVEVIAIDANGIEVPDGCRPAHNTMPVDQAFDWSIRAALSAYSQPRSGQLPSAFKQALRDSLVSHFATEWPRTHDREPRLRAARHDRLRRQNRISMAAHRHRPTETHVAGLAAGHVIQRRLLQFG